MRHSIVQCTQRRFMGGGRGDGPLGKLGERPRPSLENWGDVLPPTGKIRAQKEAEGGEGEEGDGRQLEDRRQRGG